MVVAVRLIKGAPEVILSSRLPTAAPGDRLALEPYTVAAELARGPEGRGGAEAAVAEGRRRQDQLAAAGLGAIIERLRGQGYEAAAGALLINRAGWVTDLLAYSLAFDDHPPVAEGLAVREALRHGLAACARTVSELDEKSLPDTAAALFDIGPEALQARLKALGAAAGRPWRKEQKLACLAAWVTLAASA